MPYQKGSRKPSAETPYWLKATNTPGMSVALLEGGKTRDVLHFGSSDAAGKSPITEATIFPAASLSKQAFLYAVLKTIEAGKLDVNRPLIQYLDKPYDAVDADLAQITARHVLTHTTGWPNWPQGNAKLKALRSPGGIWGYSGAAYVYMQDVLEVLWNETPPQYIQRLVFDPLGMRESGFVWRDGYEKTVTRGFEESGNPVDQFRPDKVNSAASLHTTAREYGLLLEAYLKKDLQKAHPDVYRRLVEIDTRLGWALGWGTADDALWQWGHNNGFKAFTALIPSKNLGIVVLTNGAGGQRVAREWVNAWLETNLPAFFFPRVAL